MSLFRPEAVTAQQNRWLGEIILIRPVSVKILTACAVMFAVALCAFLAWGSYTKRSTVTGRLAPEAGLMKIYSPETATVLEKHVTEGQHVRTGDVLYVLSTERQSTLLGATQAAISEQLMQRQASLRNEITQTESLQRQEAQGLRNRIDAAARELAEIDDQIDLQKERVGLAHRTVGRYRSLLKQDFITRQQLQEKQENLLDQQTRLQALERERITLQRDQSALRTDLAGLSFKQQNDIARLQRLLATAAQEQSESEARRSLSIVAPGDGTATAVLADVGQAVSHARPLLSIVPRDSALQAELYAPSRAVGFVQPGGAVRLRFQAYPYQKFGHQEGVIKSITQSTLLPDELGTLSDQARRADEPLYRITVDLPAQTMHAYGQDYPLQSGMALEADILHETLKLYEWVLEPLHTLSGKL
jgi:membrane fusion protein